MRSPARSFLAVILSTLVACATAAGARRAELCRALDQARISGAPAEIWPEVQRFLYLRGYPLVGEDWLAVGKPVPSSAARMFSLGFQTRVRADGYRVLETDPRGNTRARVRVEATPAEGGGSRLRVRLLKLAEMNMVETTESRDEDLEVALLERLDPAAAARVTGRPLPLAVAGGDRWARVRPLLGSWTGELADGTPVRWHFELVSDAQFLEMHGTPLLFAGPAARRGGEEMGRISPAADGDRLVWNQFTSAGRVDRYEALATPTATPTGDEPLVFVAPSPESLPAGTRARLSLRRSGDQLEAALGIAKPGNDFAPAGAVRLLRAP